MRAELWIICVQKLVINMTKWVLMEICDTEVGLRGQWAVISYCSVTECTSSREWAVIRRWVWVITMHCLPLLLPLVIHLNQARGMQEVSV